MEGLIMLDEWAEIAILHQLLDLLCLGSCYIDLASELTFVLMFDVLPSFLCCPVGDDIFIPNPLGSD